MKWRDKAACLGAPQHLFIPEDKGNTIAKRKNTEAAKAFCAVCPVIEDCRQFVRQHASFTLIGIWAGQTTQERRKAMARGEFNGCQS
jgi:WhiB family redox-sensing transcriptional regulator